MVFLDKRKIWFIIRNKLKFHTKGYDKEEYVYDPEREGDSEAERFPRQVYTEGSFGTGRLNTVQGMEE